LRPAAAAAAAAGAVTGLRIVVDTGLRTTSVSTGACGRRKGLPTNVQNTAIIVRRTLTL